MELCCTKCGSTNLRKYVHVSGRERIDCNDCHSYVKWGWGERSWKDRAVDVLRRSNDPDATALVREAEERRGGR
jgi:hypothetical protein